MVNAHLGCGQRHIPGFIHVDLADYPHIDHRHDVRTLPFFPDETVDLIYASHLLEYFDRTEVETVLCEWRRVLTTGGVLRIAVPDFEALAAVYQQGASIDTILGPVYGRMRVETKEGEKILYHRTIYDFQSLKELLTRLGFNRIKRYHWRDTVHRKYDDFSQAYLPNMDKENGVLISLNVEAVKG